MWSLAAPLLRSSVSERPSARAASCSIFSKPPLCVIAPEHVHVSSSPPGCTARIARLLSLRYLRSARGRSLMVGAYLVRGRVRVRVRLGLELGLG